MRQQLSYLFRHRWRRIGITLLPLLFALLHVSNVLHLQVLERLDNIIYDTRLRATMPRTLDERIVIVDIDEKSLDRVGHWPWGRDKLAALTQELFERQQHDKVVVGNQHKVVVAQAEGVEQGGAGVAGDADEVESGSFMAGSESRLSQGKYDMILKVLVSKRIYTCILRACDSCPLSLHGICHIFFCLSRTL
mgnify:CR=1 FL=1